MLSAMTAGTLLSAARRINATRHGAGRRWKRLPVLIFVTDERRCPDPVRIAGSLPRGAAIIFRHYDAPDRAGLALRLAQVCRARGLMLLIAGDPGLARQVRAQGVHWPEGLMRRARRRHSGIVTVAAHSEAALIRARSIGADAALLSPVFPTRSGAEKKPLGLMRFAALVHRARLPVYALGGVSAVTARRLAGSGAAGLAAVDAFLEV
jgi:thiamine-phosphate pyrophosphorylase